MQRNHLFVVLLALAALAAGAFFAFAGDTAPPLDTGGPQPVVEQPVEVPNGGEGTVETLPTDASSKRERAASVGSSVADDPEIRAAMTGYKGRVVDHTKAPVGKCGVRLYRGALDSVLRPGVDVFSELPTMEPQYVAGETQTHEDGTFVIEGVWPRGFCILFAGLGTDAPTHRIVTVTPQPGEVVDLGDVVLNDAAVAIGKLVDENDKPVAGALVRAADIPGQVLDFVPVDRFDPEGCILIREKQSPVKVVEFPAWVSKAMEHLPIPQATSGPDGTFRLVGIAPGNNMVAANKKGLVGVLKKSIRFEAGKTKDLGTMTMTEGEEVTVKVVDAAGKAVTGAEVVCGTMGLVAPVDFGVRMGTTDAEGRVAGLGFGRGKATAAARRSSKDPWVLAEPQPVLGDVVVTLPATASMQVRVTFAGQPVKEPQLRLLQGGEEEPATMMAMFGMAKSIELAERSKPQEDGSLLVEDLPLGRYVLCAKTEGSVTKTTEIELTPGLVQVAVELVAGKSVSVRVLGPGDEPIRNAVVYVVDEGDKKRGDFPIVGGHTNAEGRVTVTEMVGDEGRCSAEHPKWGLAHTRFKVVDGEVVVRMQVPGWIEGTLQKDGKPAPVGKYTILTMLRPDWENRREAVESVPLMSTPGLDGTFTMRALQPGKYSLQVVSALDLLGSPGGVMEMGQNMFQEEMPRGEVEVVSGQGATCALDFAGKTYEGPTGHFVGFVQVDGVVPQGGVMEAWTQAGRRVSKIEPNGRFEMRDVPVGQVQIRLQVQGAEGGMFGRESLWSRSYEVKAGETIDVQIDVRTASCSGIALQAGGVPAAGVHVTAQGRALDATSPNQEHHTWLYTTTNAEGRFEFKQMVEGIYTFEVARWGGEQDKFRGRLEDVRIVSGPARTDLVLNVRAAIKVSGRIDITALPKKPEWSWISIHRADPNAPTDRTKATDQAGGFGLNDDLTFETGDLDAGTFYARFHFQDGEQWVTWEVPDAIVVPETGVSGLLLRPQPQAPAPARK